MYFLVFGIACFGYVASIAKKGEIVRKMAPS
jgi:hypothetical protein